MNKTILKITPLALVGVFALTGCPAEEESSSAVQNYQDFINSLADGTLSEEDIIILETNDNIQNGFLNHDFVSQTIDVDYNVEPTMINPGFESQAVYKEDRTDTITFYQNDIIEVTGDVYYAPWDGVTPGGEQGLNGGFGPAQDYNYDEVIYVDHANNKLNATYTQNGEITNPLSFHKSIDFDWTIYDAMFNRNDSGETFHSYHDAINELIDAYGQQLAPENVITTKTATKTTDSNGVQTLELNYDVSLEVLPLFTCTIWGNSYEYMYCIRDYQLGYSYKIVDGKITDMAFQSLSFRERLYYDLNEIPVAELGTDYNMDNPSLTPEDIALLDLRAIPSSEQYIWNWEFYNFHYEYGELAEYSKALPDASAYRVADQTDVGDGIFYDLTIDMTSF